MYVCIYSWIILCNGKSLLNAKNLVFFLHDLCIFYSSTLFLLLLVPEASGKLTKPKFYKIDSVSFECEQRTTTKRKKKKENMIRSRAVHLLILIGCRKPLLCIASHFFFSFSFYSKISATLIDTYCRMQRWKIWVVMRHFRLKMELSASIQINLVFNWWDWFEHRGINMILQMYLGIDVDMHA